MSMQECKHKIETAVDECAGKAGVIVSVSDQYMDTVLELAHFAQNCGVDYIVLHAPAPSFVHDRGEALYPYYKTFCDQLDTSIAMWGQPDSSYLMQPEECARICVRRRPICCKLPRIHM